MIGLSCLFLLFKVVVDVKKAIIRPELSLLDIC